MRDIVSCNTIDMMPDSSVSFKLNKFRERVNLFDGLRGVAVLMMLFAHTAHFISTNTNSHILFLVRTANLLTFSFFLISSGIATYYAYILGSKNTTTYEEFIKIGKRTFILYIGYAILVIVSSLTSYQDLSLYALGQKVFLGLLGIDCPPFSEFILTLLLYGVSTYFLKGFYVIIVQKTWLAIMIATCIYGVGNALFALDLPFPYQQWKALLSGSALLLRFSLFHYFPIFITGMLIARNYHHQSIEKFRMQTFMVTVFFGLVCLLAFMLTMYTSVPFVDPFVRWPPSLGFIALGIFSSFSVLFILQSINLFPKVLLLLGKFSYDIYLSHIIILLLFSAFITWKTESFLLTILGSIAVGLCSFIFLLSRNRVNTNMSLLRLTLIESKRYNIRVRYILPIVLLVLLTGYNLSKGNSHSVYGDYQVKEKLRNEFSDVYVGINRHWFFHTKLPESEDILLTAVINDNNVHSDQIEVTYQIDNTSITDKLTETTPGTYIASIDPTTLSLGSHTITFTISGSQYNPFHDSVSFMVSEPVFVSWTFDWEGWDASDFALTSIEEESVALGNIPFTHFVSPRTFFPTVVTEDRIEHIVKWLKRRKQYFGDEIELHTHMHFDLVEAAGITPRKSPIWGYRTNEGYDVLTTAYSEEELTTILRWSKSFLEEKGFSPIIGYRAGGWFADETTLNVLRALGFSYDASGRETTRSGAFRNTPWNLNATTQPYVPSENDQNVSTALEMYDLLEIPNNGGTTFDLTEDSILERLYQIYTPYTRADQVKAITFVSHPQYAEREFERLRKALSEIKEISFSEDKGPILFVTQERIYQTWKR